ncbi:MAG TPA: elongation factor P [Bacillota bacterium]|nr:elongation factor P [Bacillota bacterium]HOH10750.1 elongation factor P [Bacillota bacterium]HOS50581.1 elongation factor P [Bacillota bacterium]HOY89843.1 elongation factor P [Bacillota bacterium]HPI01525.1 elongation factor P [Bacillota bacterium]
MVSTNDLRTGLTVEWDGSIWTVVDFQHVKPGKGAAFVRVKLRNIITGATIENAFNAGEKLSRAQIDFRKMQYLYESDGQYHFMDQDNYEQISLSADVLGDSLKYLKENMELGVQQYQGKVVGIELPNFVELEIVETDPGLRGDTASGGTKPAKLETGAVIQVPLFIQQGEKIRVDTRTNKYLERV